MAVAKKNSKKSISTKALTVSKKPDAKKARKKSKKKQEKLTSEQKLQQKEIRSLMENLGFSRAPNIDHTEFVYNDRTTELDDIFFNENVVVILEYTTGSPGDHLIKKKVIYDKINENPNKFIQFLIDHLKFKPLNSFFAKTVLPNFTVNQLQVRIVYASKEDVSEEHKKIVDNVLHFQYPIVKYFESISKVIKKSAKYEFFDFLNIEFSKVGNAIKSSSLASDENFLGHILPEEHSSFKEGYKLVSFYIDAESLMKRAFVLRKDSWRNKDNIGLYQRMFVAKKIRSMRKYLHEQNRVFVNNIIVTLPTDQITLLDEQKKELEIDDKGNFKKAGKTNVTPTIIKIENKSNIIGIVDGQHRTFAYHEGDDVYEKTIAKFRNIQNLLVTGILYPKGEVDENRIKFEAKLFLEINSNQSGASSELKQEIEYILSPFSTIAIAKAVLKELNQSGPLANRFEEYWFEKAKLKTASVISFGLKPLLKFDGNDSLFKIWGEPRKNNLRSKFDNYTLLQQYKSFCSEQIRNVFIGLKNNIDRNDWKVDRSNSQAILSVTTINGVVNCLRLLIEDNKTGDTDYYTNKFKAIKGFDFKSYKSSQYRKMGEEMYKRCFT